MEIKLALIADAANSSREGKLNVLGAFNLIWGEVAPISITFVFVVRLGVFAIDYGKPIIVDIVQVDEDGREIGNMSASFSVDPEISLPYIEADFIHKVERQVVFPHFGQYEFRILLNGKQSWAIPCQVLKIGFEETGERQ